MVCIYDYDGRLMQVIRTGPLLQLEASRGAVHQILHRTPVFGAGRGARCSVYTSLLSSLLVIA